MRFHIRAVDQHFGWRPALGGKRIKYRTPYAFLGLALVPIIQRLVGTVGRRSVLPATPRLQHMHDSADHPPIIDTRYSAWLVRQQRLQSTPLPVIRPKSTRHHKLPIKREHESHSRRRGNPVYGSEPTSSPARTRAANKLRRSTRSSRPPGSTSSTPKRGCATCSPCRRRPSGQPHRRTRTVVLLESLAQPDLDLTEASYLAYLEECLRDRHG